MTKEKNTNPAVVVPAAPAPVSAAPVQSVKTHQQQPTVAEQIWSEIKSKEILMFALPGQKVSDYCTPVSIDPNRCFLVVKATATLPALEAAVGTDYECNAAEKYVIVSRKPKNAF